MITSILGLTTMVFILFKITTFYNRRKKLPPGPIIWPVLGNIVEIKLANANYPHLALAKMAKKYGPVMGLGFGVHYSVVVSGLEEIKDIFTRRETCEHRFEFPYVQDRNYNKNLGIVFSSGNIWHVIRRFTIKTLNEFGFGKTKSMEIVMKEETDDMVQYIRSIVQDNNGIWNVDSHYLAACAINVIWSLVGGHRFSHNDEKLIENLRLNDMVSEIFGHNNKYSLFPFLRNWFPKFVQHDIHIQTHKQLQGFTKGLIDDVKIKRLERVDDTEAQNFIEVFTDEIMKNNKNKNEYFTEEQLIVILMDLFFAGSETTSMTLSWIILFLTLNPESQLKLQNEIAEVIPTLENINLRDSEKMPYLRAVMLEASRLANVVPIASPRLTTADIQFKNVVIPKGTALFSNTVPIFTDKKYWGDPELFRPERFLNESGEIIPQHAERIAIFGFGKRLCVGNTVAWNSLIIFTTALFGNFTFESIKGNEPSAENPISALTIKPRKYSVRVVPHEYVK